MKKALFLISLFQFFCIQTYSQKIEFGNVTKAELSEKYHPNDTSAVAAILYKKTKTTFKYSLENGFILNTEFTIKIKIYKKEGFSWANFEIPYYIGYKELVDDTVEILKAYTYNLENGKIEKEKVTSEGKFVEAYNEFWKKKSITFPNIKVGSIIELKYNLISHDISVLPDFKYQYEIPVNYAEYKTEIPSFFLYKAIKIGFVEVEMNEKVESTSQRFEEKVDKRSEDRTLSYNQIVTTYSAKNSEALIEEEYVNNIDNYYAKLEHELQTIQYPDEKAKQISKSWENVTTSIYEDKNFGPELKKFNYFLLDLKNLVNTDATEVEKVNAIFDFLKNRMTWNGKFGYSTIKGVELAYSDKSGNVAEINLMLTSMLKMAGLDAKPVLISTRENGVAMFPNRSKFNYVISGVKIGANIVLLDATSKNSFPNILPIRDLNWFGRMIEKDGTSTDVDLIPKTVSNDIVNIIATITTNGTIEGKLKEQYFDSNKFVFNEKYSILNNEANKERIERYYKGIEVEDYSIINKTDANQPLIESYSFKHNNCIDTIGDKMFFSPMLFLAQNTNPFKQDNREYPIDFAYAKEYKYLITITIPDGFTVESIPKSTTITMPDTVCNLKYLISNTNNQIQLSLTLTINVAIVPSDYYDELKLFFNELVKKETEKIVLKKI